MSNKKPLEWVFGFINTPAAAVANYRIALGLRDTEVAEIHKLDSSIVYANIPDVANDDLDAHMAISVDPDALVSPAVAVNHLDLEWFYHHPYCIQQEIGAAGQNALRNSDARTSEFVPPVLVGTDVGLIAIGDAAVAVDFWVRLYFTRRKASVMELNQILLKRR